MSDYISRQAAIEACEHHKTDGLPCKNAACSMCADSIKALPSADVVEVVRCKDCKHYYFAENRIPQEQRYVCDLDGDRWKADSFCSYAERRTDEIN